MAGAEAESRARGGWIVAGMVAVLAVASVGLVLRGGDDSRGWAYPIDDEEVSDLVAAGGRACATRGDQLFCVDGATGQEVFTTELPDVGTGIAPVGDTLVVAADGGGRAGDLYGYSLDGELLWEAEELDDLSLDEFEDELVVAGEVVAVSADDGDDVIAVDATSGAELWRDDDLIGEVLSDGQRFYGERFDDDDESYATTISALDPVSGDELWTTEIADEDDFGAYVREVIGMGEELVGLVVESETSDLVAVAAETGEERWRLPLDDFDSEVVHAGDVTVVIDAADVYGYDDTGTEVWQSRLPVEADDDPEDVYAELYVGDDGTLYAYEAHVFLIDPADGSVDAAIRGQWPFDVVAVGDHVVLSVYDGLAGVVRPG